MVVFCAVAWPSRILYRLGDNGVAVHPLSCGDNGVLLPIVFRNYTAGGSNDLQFLFVELR